MQETLCTTEQEQCIGYWLKRLHSQMRKKGDAQMKQWGLTISQVNILVYLAQYPRGTVSQKQIEDAFGLKHSTVIGTLGRLQKKGFLMVTVNPDDHRGRLVSLKQETEAFFQQAWAAQRQHEQELRRNLTDAEAAELLRLLQIVLKTIEAAHPERKDPERPPTDSAKA
jgi:DNA-binding MarR family transcriptional regulator